MEKNFSGYCRVSDGPRLVFLEQDDDGTWEADCNYDADCLSTRSVPSAGKSRNFGTKREDNFP